MRIAPVAGAQLQYDFRGGGRPVLLLHSAVLADAMVPLLAEPALTDNFLVIHYCRRGYGGSTKPSLPLSIGQHAADAAALLRQFGVLKAHIVGHDYGALIALQLALDFPELVGALVLMEPPLINLVAAGPAFRQQLQPFARLYERGDKGIAVDAYLQAVFGPDCREHIEQALGSAAMARAVADAETFLNFEAQALDLWPFSQTISLRLTGPMLSIFGENTAPLFAESHELLMHWYPKAEELELPGATHALPLCRSREVASAAASFLARHPMDVRAGRIAQRTP